VPKNQLLTPVCNPIRLHGEVTRRNPVLALPSIRATLVMNKFAHDLLDSLLADLQATQLQMMKGAEVADHRLSQLLQDDSIFIRCFF
jgi:hypothetical protein